MIRRYVKIILKAVIFIFLASCAYIGYKYYCGWLLVRQATDNISNILANENCLASEKIYSDGHTLYSMQDKALEYLKELDKSNNIDFDINETELISLNQDSVIQTWYSKNGVNTCPNSYLTAAQKGDVIHVRVNGIMRCKLTFMPSWSNEAPYVISIPISIETNKIASDFYKSQTDNRNY